MRQRTLFALASICLLPVPASGQTPSIETRKVAMLVDHDGKGFTRAPMSVARIANGRFAVTEMNELPLVVDSTGRLVKRWPRGDGPGEFRPNAGPARGGKGDTLFIGNHTGINVFDRNLKFVRFIPVTEIYTGGFFPVDGDFVLAAGKRGIGTMINSLHVVSASGKVLRSFLSDTLIRPRRGNDPEYGIAPGAGSTIWAWNIWGHRLERWTMSGRRTQVIDAMPAWFVPKDSIYRARIKSVREADGLLWVFSEVPVPDARARATAALKKSSGEVDARAFPFEQMATSYLEVYAASSGQLLAGLPINAYGITLLDDRHFMIYTPSSQETAQLEIWEMKLRR
ncbi:MAG TPA: hypothetical protein VFO55_10310 [Gemmatimonadaceae bacterium]|nr:hypothetical protein [Gemmatimonadaceae bacterium]